MSRDARNFVRDLILDVWRPRSEKPTAEWALATIVMPSGEGGVGKNLPYDASKAPVAGLIFDFFSAADPSKELHLMKDSQSGATLAVAVECAHSFAEDPQSWLIVSHKQTAAAEISKDRIMPILRQMGEKIHDDVTSRQVSSSRTIRGHKLYLAGGQGVSDLISRQGITRIALDEAEEHPLLDEGTTIGLTRARMKQQATAKFVAFSKPKRWANYLCDPNTGTTRYVVEAGTAFCNEWLQGTQEKLMVPCPHCGKRQELRIEQLRYETANISGLGGAPEYDERKVIRETFYECCYDECKQPIKERQKDAMVKAGIWMAAPLTEKEAKANGFAMPRRVGEDLKNRTAVLYKRPTPGVRSAHISALYNILSSNATWGELALKWIRAQNDSAKMRLFYNDDLGLPYEEFIRDGCAVNPHLLLRLKGDYMRLGIMDPMTGMVGDPEVKLPVQPARIFLCIDRQQTFFPWILVVQAQETRDLYVVDWGSCGSEDHLQMIVETRFQAPDGRTCRVSQGLMDSRHQPSEVVKFCLRHKVMLHHIAPAMGLRSNIGMAVKWFPIDKQLKDAGDLPLQVPVSFQRIGYDSSFWEREVYYERLRAWTTFLDPNTPGAIHSDDCKRHAARRPRIWLPHDTDQDLLNQISNMQEVYKDPANPSKGMEWEKIRKGMPNDYGDMLKLALICEYQYGEKRRTKAV